MIFGKVGCLWFGLAAAAHGSVVSVGGGWVLSKVKGLWFGLVGVAHRSIGLACWRKVFGKVACL